MKKWGAGLLIERTRLMCDICGTHAQPDLEWRGSQIAATCQMCKAWVRWVPTSRLWRALLELQSPAGTASREPPRA